LGGTRRVGLLLQNEYCEEVSRSFYGTTEKEVDVFVTTETGCTERQTEVDNSTGEPALITLTKIIMLIVVTCSFRGQTGPSASKVSPLRLLSFT